MHGMTGSAAARNLATRDRGAEPAQAKGARRILICAWCRSLLCPEPRRGDEVENFGICPRCLRDQLSRCQDLPLS